MRSTAARRAQFIETQVKYEDGRSGKIRPICASSDVKTFAPQAGQRAKAGLRVNRPTHGQTDWRRDPRPSEHLPALRRGEGAHRHQLQRPKEHEIRSIIGPNGAGKSSMLNVINGVYHPQEGRSSSRRTALRPKMEPHEAAEQGIARTFQNIACSRA
jgi:hypothetical protein